MQEVENFFHPFEQKRLLGLLSSNSFPWLYYKNVSGLDSNQMKIAREKDKRIREGFGFQHLVYGTNHTFDKKMYDNIDFVDMFTKAIKSKFDVNVVEIQRIMIGLTTAESSYKSTDYFFPHVDRFTPHKTLIYNVNTHDGGTRFFQERFDGKVNDFRKTYVYTATSKQGSAILFDGFTYHAGAQPTKDDKIIINVNFV